MSGKKYPCILVGGFMDMTKMILINRQETLCFYEPDDSVDQIQISGSSVRDIDWICKQVSYRIVGETPNGVLIYEKQ